MNEAKNVGLIVLQGQGDIEVKFVPVSALDWISAPFESRRSCYDDPIPDQVRQDLIELGVDPAEIPLTISITCGSWDNDRALLLPGLEFASLTKAINHVASNGWTVADEYIGGIY